MKKRKYFFHYMDKIFWFHLTEEELKEMGLKNEAVLTEEQFNKLMKEFK